jgi:TRAP-type C4-dicarboxylate transport system permease small subunit
MHRTVQRVTHVYSRFLAYGASLAMITLFLIVFINSVRRYTIGKSLEWGEQLPVFIAIYGVMFGAAWAYLQDKHIRFTILVGFLSDSLTRKLYLLVDLIMVATGALLAYSGWLFVIKRGGVEASGLINLAKELRSLFGWDALIWLGHQYPYQAAMMVGGGLLCIAAVLRFLMRFSDENGG